MSISLPKSHLQDSLSVNLSHLLSLKLQPYHPHSLFYSFFSLVFSDLSFQESAGRFRGHIATGLVGISILTQWATQNQEAEFVYGMLKKRTYPGYLYMIDHGATLTWEEWDGEREMFCLYI